MEEKGSDVNLATMMLVDAYEQDCDVAVLVTNDSDLALPMRVLSERLSRPVGLVSPTDADPSRRLMRERPAFVRRLRTGLLANSQFSDEVREGDGGSVTKPPTW